MINGGRVRQGGDRVTERYSSSSRRTNFGGTFTAIEPEPGSRIVYRADFAGLQPMITYRVEPAGAGTRFTRAVEMQPRGFAKLMTPMMKRMLPKRNHLFVQNLKRALET